MAKKSKIEKWKREKVKPKYSTRIRNRCRLCGRPRGYIRDFELCRICFRQLAWQGVIPGVKRQVGEPSEERMGILLSLIIGVRDEWRYNC